MKNIIVLNSFLILFLFYNFVCSEKSTEPTDDITAKPVVKKSSLDYNHEFFAASFPDTTSMNNISRAYSNNYSQELRNKLLVYMKGEIVKLGEDVNIFDSVLSRTGCKLTGEYLLPTYAERAKYENQEVWIFQVTYGLDEPNFGHYKCFAFGVVNLDTLAYKGCK